MSVKILKNTYRMGQATVDGLSFPESQIMTTLKQMFDAIQQKADTEGAIITRPATVLFTIEQEVILNDD